MTTLVNTRRAADKLRSYIGECSPTGYATIPVTMVYMAVRALEQQERELAMYREQQERMGSAIVEALTVEVER